jgi:hypothetical protein
MRTRVVVASAAATLALSVAGTAHADTRSDVCTGYRLGMSPGQIADGLERNDGRENYQRSWNDTVWPIITGDCDE